MSSKLAATIIGIFWLSGAYAMAADGLITIASSYGPKETMDRLETEIKARGMTVFAHIDHAAGAAEVGLSLRPTDLLIFGNASGTPLMQSNQTIGNRFTAESAGLGGCSRQNMAVLQRPALARAAPRAWH